MPHLDVYNEEDIDEREYEALSPEARAAAEREMRKRDRQDDLVHGRARPALLYGKCVCVVCVSVCECVCMFLPVVYACGVCMCVVCTVICVCK